MLPDVSSSADRLRQFHVELHEKNPQICGNVTMVTSIYQDAVPPSNPTTFTFDASRAARWVRVIMYWPGAMLSLCQVEVYGEPACTEGKTVTRGRLMNSYSNG